MSDRGDWGASPGSFGVGTARIRAPRATGAIAGRFAVEAALAHVEADATDRSILIVRRVGARLAPGAGGTSPFRREVENAVGLLRAQAARPGDAGAPDAPAILYGSPEQLLLALAVDLASGVAHERWYWRDVRLLLPPGAMDSLSALLSAHAHAFPAIVHAADAAGLTPIIAAALDEPGSARVLEAIEHAFGLSSLCDSVRGAVASGAGPSASSRPTRVRDSASGASEPAPTPEPRPDPSAPRQRAAPPAADPPIELGGGEPVLNRVWRAALFAVARSLKGDGLRQLSALRAIREVTAAVSVAPRPDGPTVARSAPPDAPRPIRSDDPSGRAAAAAPEATEPLAERTDEGTRGAAATEEPDEPTAAEPTALPIREDNGPAGGTRDEPERHSSASRLPGSKRHPLDAFEAVTSCGGTLFLVNALTALAYEEMPDPVHAALAELCAEGGRGAWRRFAGLSWALLTEAVEEPDSLAADPIWPLLRHLQNETPDGGPPALDPETAPLLPYLAALLYRRVGGDAADDAVRRTLLRAGRVEATATHVDVHFRLTAADPAIRRAGLDLDPGWVPWLGRIVSFHYH